jgi:hypothetical protein
MVPLLPMVLSKQPGPMMGPASVLNQGLFHEEHKMDKTSTPQTKKKP